MARWTASAKWAAGPALDGRRATLLVLGLNEGLGVTRAAPNIRDAFVGVRVQLPRLLLRLLDK